MSNKVFAPEKVRELVTAIGRAETTIIAMGIFERWLEQNPIEPTVEVGQVWQYVGENKQHDKSDYEIVLLGYTKQDWEESVTYKREENQKFYTRPLSDFLAKFERVGGEE